MLLLKPSCSIPHLAALNGEVCCIESVYDCAFASRKTKWIIPDPVRQIIRRSGSPKSASPTSTIRWASEKSSIHDGRFPFPQQVAVSRFLTEPTKSPLALICATNALMIPRSPYQSTVGMELNIAALNVIHFNPDLNSSILEVVRSTRK